MQKFTLRIKYYYSEDIIVKEFHDSLAAYQAYDEYHKQKAVVHLVLERDGLTVVSKTSK
jgi:hypothetical protein